MDNHAYITGLCPNCSLTLDYAPGESTVFCPGCSLTLPVSALVLCTSEKGRTASEDALSNIADSITSAQAGLIYADNFCESYDWADFAENTALSIPRLDAIAESAKLKFSSDYLTYVLDFKRLAVPFLKKIDGLELLVVELAHKYTGDDISDLLEIFDLYSSVTKKIASERKTVARQLSDDIRLAKKFDAPAEVIKDLQMSLEHFEKTAGSVKPVSSINDIEEYKKIKLAKDSALVNSLRAAGIDAEKTYEKAHQLFSLGDVDNALHLLVAIYPYRDSGELISQHSGVFSFGNGLYEMGGATYLKKRRITHSENGDVQKSKEFSLFEVKQAITSPSPALTDITKIIGSFGTKIFFIRAGKALCCYDTASEELHANVRILDEAQETDYVVDDEHFAPFFSPDKSRFYIRKKLHSDAKRGIFSKRGASFNTDNNYSLLCVNMDTVSCKTQLAAIVDVMDYFDGKIFYSAICADGANEFRMLNTKSDDDEAMLNASCNIHNVSAGKIIYSVWAPNEYNVNLFVCNMKTGSELLIEKNASGYYAVIGEKLFYNIGSGKNSRLISVNLDGSQRCEVMDNSERIVLLRSGWIYYKCGAGRNTCLKKISIDGKSEMLIADKFKRLLKMSNGYVYYISTDSSLCMARCDGAGARVIAKNIRVDKVIIDDNRIYYINDDTEADGKIVSSLYSTALDGKELERLCYDVSDVNEYTAEKLYICKNESQDFMITTPISKKESRTERVSAAISDYCSFDKKTGDIERIATLGVPETTYTIVKTGFIFKRKKKLFSTVTPLPRQSVSYSRAFVSSAGETRAEDEASSEALPKSRKTK